MLAGPLCLKCGALHTTSTDVLLGCLRHSFPDMCYPEAPFYLAVNYNHTIHGFWYKNQKIGIQRIGVIMKKWRLIRKEDKSFC